MQRITYNVIAALVTANVYQCAPTDVSHFLHPRMKTALNAVVANLRLACFWYSARNIGTMEALRQGVAYLDPLPMSERIRMLDQAAGQVQTPAEPAMQASSAAMDIEVDIKPDIASLQAGTEAVGQAAEAERRHLRENDKTVDTRPDSYFLENDFEQHYDDRLLSTVAKIKIKEACRHFRDALTTPGWLEWMENSVSLPFDACPEQFSARIRDAWSDSRDDNPDAIDSHSLALLRNANLRGATEQALHIKGWDARAYKCVWFFEEMEKMAARAKLEAGKRAREEEKEAKQREKEKQTHKSGYTAAGRATPLLKASVKKQESKINQPDRGKPKAKRAKKDALAEQLDEATRNAQQAAKRPGWMILDETIPRPLPEMVHAASRCAKVNHVMKRMIESDPSDRFVIFGVLQELAHVAEALVLIDVKQ